MKATATEIRSDDGRWLAGFALPNLILVNVRGPAELAAILPYLQHAANCQPDRVRFTPEPMAWEKANDWLWYSGEYAIAVMNEAHYLIFRGDCKRSYLSLGDAQQAAERHREGSK